MTEKLTENASLGEIMAALQSVQTDFQTSKDNITTVLGSPFLSTDKLDITKTKTETLKCSYIILSDNPIYEKKLSYEELENELLIITNELQGGLL
ncbi:hypothetical protein [Clostridioides sp. ES-S-0049-02]|uniref:hypothetical protein n=1 Tax=Clostridioides sp. ES-S-0049-02 TaxID=2770778 RepID=UPI001D11EC2F